MKYLDFALHLLICSLMFFGLIVFYAYAFEFAKYLMVARAFLDFLEAAFKPLPMCIALAASSALLALFSRFKMLELAASPFLAIIPSISFVDSDFYALANPFAFVLESFCFVAPAILLCKDGAIGSKPESNSVACIRTVSNGSFFALAIMGVYILSGCIAGKCFELPHRPLGLECSGERFIALMMLIAGSLSSFARFNQRELIASYIAVQLIVILFAGMQWHWIWAVSLSSSIPYGLGALAALAMKSALSAKRTPNAEEKSA